MIENSGNLYFGDTNYHGTINNAVTGYLDTEINNFGIIYNYGEIENQDIVTNNGTIYNICRAIHSGNPPNGNSVIEPSHCVYLTITTGC